uniref:Uncharacterized protein n=1 Tax=viral metagenome TaxID=1070528 RepID=A0A6H2A3T9_9ZZZZ
MKWTKKPNMAIDWGSRMAGPPPNGLRWTGQADILCVVCCNCGEILKGGVK